VEPVYFDSSPFIAIFKGEDRNEEIRELLRELKKLRVRISTSIVTIQEVSVLSFRLGTVASDNYVRVNRLARIEGLSKDVALTAAKLEAQVLDRLKGLTKTDKEEDNKRRKWDCFHIATAMCLKCHVLYSLDRGMLARKEQLQIRDLDFRLPKAVTLPLFPPDED
jgi:predicted nucleic acid-binding protein